jgi:hypothetical protein
MPTSGQLHLLDSARQGSCPLGRIASTPGLDASWPQWSVPCSAGSVHFAKSSTASMAVPLTNRFSPLPGRTTPPPPPPPGAGPKGEGGEADLDRIHCTYVPHPPSTALPCIPSRSWNPRFLFTSRASGDHLEFSPCLRPARPLDTPHIRSLQSRTTHWNQSRDIDHHTTKKHRIDTCTSLYHITIRHPTRAQAGTGIRSSMGL